MIIVVLVSTVSAKSGDLIPIPDHLQEEYNKHIVEEYSDGEIDYDEYIDLELEKHKGREFVTQHLVNNWFVEKKFLCTKK